MTTDALHFFGKVYHHKFIVLKFLNTMIHDLIRRGETHDDSKFSDDEFDEYVKATQEFQGPYGTEQNDAVREKYKALFERHARRNSHHPEHYPDGVDGMTLMDIMEMLRYWKKKKVSMEN